MNIHAKEGHKVKFVSPESGYSHDQKQAETHLKVSATYTVDRTHVHNWSTDVSLKEIPGEVFNSVLFEDA